MNKLNIDELITTITVIMFCAFVIGFINGL